MFCYTLFDPQCGTDGIIYSNICELEKAACLNPTLNLEVDPDDTNCKGGN